MECPLIDLSNDTTLGLIQSERSVPFLLFVSLCRNYCTLLQIIYEVLVCNLFLFQEVQRLEVEKRHLMDVLAAHAPSCAKRPRRSGCNAVGGKNDDVEYRLPSTADQGSLSSAVPLPSAPFYPRGSSSLEMEGDNYRNFTFSSDQEDLVTDVRQRHISLESAFLADNEEEEEDDEEGEEEVKSINDDRKQRRHFKSSCSFVGGSTGASSATSQETPYFLTTKSRCLSYGFQIDNRCVAL
jgi:hypothetical protein